MHTNSIVICLKVQNADCLTSPSVCLPSRGSFHLLGTAIPKLMLLNYLPNEPFQLLLGFTSLFGYPLLCPLVIGAATHPENTGHLPDGVFIPMFVHELIHLHWGSVCAKMTAASQALSPRPIHRILVRTCYPEQGGLCFDYAKLVAETFALPLRFPNNSVSRNEKFGKPCQCKPQNSCQYQIQSER
jgi:hypothetical protein